MCLKLTFSKKLRLLTSYNFSFVFKKCNRSSNHYITILSRTNLLKYPRIGLIVSKKNVKYAHDRNRVKRLTRETFRKNQYNLPVKDFVVILKKGIINFDNHKIILMLEKLWQAQLRLLTKV